MFAKLNLRFELLMFYLCLTYLDLYFAPQDLTKTKVLLKLWFTKFCDSVEKIQKM